MEKAKLYYKSGDWNYYRTDEGETYSIRAGKYYFYHGNAFRIDKTEVKFIDGDELKELKKKVEFVIN